MVQPKILLVDDEESLAEGIELNLKMENMACVWVKDGEQALTRLGLESFHLVLLDVMMPVLDGFSVCRLMRERNDLTPVLFLTAKNTDNDRLVGFESGGDDYLGKPFQVKDLLIRIRSILRRETWYRNQSLDRKKYFGDCWVNFDTFVGHTPRGDFNLSMKEAMIFKLLIERTGTPVSREDIMQIVWGDGVIVSSRTIDNFIVRLRKYIEPDPRHPRWITTYRSLGYQFENES